MDLQIPLLVIGQRGVSTMSAQFTNRRVTHLRFDVVLSRYGIWNGVRMFVRSLGWDLGHHEEVRTGPENKIHIWEVKFQVWGQSGVFLEGSGRFQNCPKYSLRQVESRKDSTQLGRPAKGTPTRTPPSMVISSGRFQNILAPSINAPDHFQTWKVTSYI